MRTLLPLLALSGCTASLSPFVDNTDVSALDTAEVADTGADVENDEAPRNDDAGFVDSASTFPVAECVDDILSATGSLKSTTAGAGDDIDASCGGDRGADAMISFLAPEAGRWAFTLSDTYFDTVLYVLDGCEGRELACGDDGDAETVAVDSEAGEEVIVVVDAAGQGEGIFTLEASLAADSEGACANGLDDDADGLADCMDPDCADKPACSETCNDGIDNNNDGLVDCMDPSCGNHRTCEAPCADGVLSGSLPISLTGTTAGGGRDTDPTCSASSDARDRAFAFVAPSDGSYTFDTVGSSYDTVIYVLDECGGTELVCNDDIASGNLRSEVTGPLTAGQRVIVVVDGYGDAQGDFQINVR